MAVKRHSRRFVYVLAAVALVNFVAHLLVYPSLPEQVPTHWGASGAADGYGPRYMALVLAALPFLFLLLFRVIPSIDPRREGYERSWGVWRGFVCGFSLYMMAFSWVTEATVFGLIPEGSGLVGSLTFAGLGVLFVALGNYMPRVRQNYTFGVKTPWALADEHNWDRTQRMGGIVSVVWGAAMLALALFAGALGGELLVGLLVALILGGTAWLYLYSYLVFVGRLR
ncbi:SdpI family protein [Olsenella phocaeensis]|uniref:SdpI family protein n=1 Tax=Olsenella phocaeensis TaxID=1852385 RepID=UPI003A95889E